MIYVITFLGRTKDSTLPPGITNKDLDWQIQQLLYWNHCQDLSLISLESISISHPYVEIPAPQGHRTSVIFNQITLPKLLKIILSTPNKNCELNPIPTSLLKQILPYIVRIIADIINTSLRDGIFPESYKRALVRPLLKKPNLDLLDRNYRSVSNLSYVSKLVEHVATAQLINHVERHGLMEVHQLAYCAFHSTETALLKVKTDVTRAFENQEVACLILLDLSSSIQYHQPQYSAQ